MYLQKKVTHLFGGTRSLENQIDEFLDKVSEAGMVFGRAMRVYLNQGSSGEYDDFLNQAADIERRGDELRRTIETELYARTLIPDLRADVMALLEGMDHLINVYEGDLFRISIQSPEIPQAFHAGYLELTDTVVNCVDSVVLAARAFSETSIRFATTAARPSFWKPKRTRSAPSCSERFSARPCRSNARCTCAISSSESMSWRTRRKTSPTRCKFILSKDAFDRPDTGSALRMPV